MKKLKAGHHFKCAGKEYQGMVAAEDLGANVPLSLALGRGHNRVILHHGVLEPVGFTMGPVQSGDVFWMEVNKFRKVKYSNWHKQHS